MPARGGESTSKSKSPELALQVKEAVSQSGGERDGGARNPLHGKGQVGLNRAGAKRNAIAKRRRNPGSRAMRATPADPAALHAVRNGTCLKCNTCGGTSAVVEGGSVFFLRSCGPDLT